MRSVIIGVSASSSWKIGSAALKLYMGEKFSHVYIRYVDDQGRDIVFQAAHGTVHPILFTHFIEENQVIKEFTVQFTEEEYQKLRTFYYDKMGERYAYLDLVLIFIYDALKSINIPIRDHKVPGYICSQLAATMLVEIKGYQFEKPLNLIRPDDIYDKLNNNVL